MIVIAGGDLVLPDRVAANASLIVERNRIAAIDSRPRVDPGAATHIDARGCYIVPGFIDVHVHGVEGDDTLDEGDPIIRIAARLPRYGVTAFCPTTVACPPAQLRGVLAQVDALRRTRGAGNARVLPAHLESNFINPEYRGAQPAQCLRLPVRVKPDSTDVAARLKPGSTEVTARLNPGSTYDEDGDFSAQDILDEIAAARSAVGIVTLAPELPGGLDLVRALVSAGHRVSLGHSGASYDEAIAAIEAGARHATHLFNRMPPVGHRTPGLAGAVLARDEVAAELICDGYHVHPGMCRVAVAAKGPRGIMAITDGTGGSGLPPGSTARLGGRRIRVGEQTALLDDGTLAGSTLTMDRAFANIVTTFGRSLPDAAAMCAATPARELGLSGYGAIAEGAFADLVLLDRDFRVAATLIDGEPVYRRGATA
jgi:N-acetylglucosamine-6-phosphate deacetylase